MKECLNALLGQGYNPACFSARARKKSSRRTLPTSDQASVQYRRGNFRENAIAEFGFQLDEGFLDYFVGTAF
jgi:hypothetical protein